MRDKLSIGQMGHLLRTEKQGFSVRAFAPGVGDRASHGYMVAQEGMGEDFVPRATPQQGMTFITDREAALRQSDVYFGAYEGAEPARTALDVSDKYPSTFTGNVTAASQAVSLNQESYGHLEGPKDYTDIPNPHYQPGAGHGFRGVSLDQMGGIIATAHARHPDEGIDSPAPSRSARLTKPSGVR